MHHWAWLLDCTMGKPVLFSLPYSTAIWCLPFIFSLQHICSLPWIFISCFQKQISFTTIVTIFEHPALCITFMGGIEKHHNSNSRWLNLGFKSLSDDFDQAADIIPRFVKSLKNSISMIRAHLTITDWFYMYCNESVQRFYSSLRRMRITSIYKINEKKWRKMSHKLDNMFLDINPSE